MIKFVEDLTPERREEYTAFCSRDVFGLKTMGPLWSYGLGYDFVSAWEQRAENGRLTAFLSKYYGTMSLCALPDCDREELLAFLEIIGFGALFGPAELLGASYPAGEQGCVMVLPAGKACIATETEARDVSLDFDTDYRAFYDVLSVANPGYLDGEYTDFLTDFSHRVRHGTASFTVLREQGRPVSTTAALVLQEKALFLGAVATLPEARGKHYASSCIHAFCSRCPEQKVYLCCRRDKQAFYEGLGFEKEDEYLELASSQK